MFLAFIAVSFVDYLVILLLVETFFGLYYLLLYSISFYFKMKFIIQDESGQLMFVYFTFDRRGISTRIKNTPGIFPVTRVPYSLHDLRNLSGTYYVLTE